MTNLRISAGKRSGKLLNKSATNSRRVIKASDGTNGDLLENQLKEMIKRKFQDELSKIDKESH